MPRPLPTPACDPLRMIPAKEGCRIEVDLLAVRDGRAGAGLPAGPPSKYSARRRRSAPATGYGVSPTFRRRRARGTPGRSTTPPSLRADGVYSRLLAEVPECISVIQPGRWLSMARLLDQVRHQGNRLLEAYLDPRCAEMAEAVLLGQREEVDSGRTENFMATGTIHLLVIAGLHLGILAGALFWVLRRTPCRAAGWPGWLRRPRSSTCSWSMPGRRWSGPRCWCWWRVPPYTGANARYRSTRWPPRHW